MFVGEEGALLMVVMSFMKTNVYHQLHHMKLISTSTIAACAMDVQDHTMCSSSILELASTFVFYLSFIMNSFVPTKKNSSYTSYGKHEFDDRTHLCVFMYAIYTFSQMCTCKM